MEWPAMRDRFEELFNDARKRGETQQTIAARGGLRQNKISNLLHMKRGKGPAAETFIRAIEGLGITPAEFFTQNLEKDFGQPNTYKGTSTASGYTAPEPEPQDPQHGAARRRSIQASDVLQRQIADAIATALFTAATALVPESFDDRRGRDVRGHHAPMGHPVRRESKKGHGRR